MPKRDKNSPPPKPQSRKSRRMMGNQYSKGGPGNPKGNPQNLALPHNIYDTPENRAAVVEEYRLHLSQGMSKGTFLECDYRTVEKVIHDHPTEFLPGTLERLEKLSRHFWEKYGIAGTFGKIKGFNASSWAINMRHRFAWDNAGDGGGDRPTVVVLNLGKELKPPPMIEHQPKQHEQQKVISPYDAE